MGFLNRIAAFLDAIPYALIALFLRIVAAHPFFVSGQTKIEGPTIDGEHLGLDMTIQIPTGLRDAVIGRRRIQIALPFPGIRRLSNRRAGIRAAHTARPWPRDTLLRFRSLGDHSGHTAIRLPGCMVDGPFLLDGVTHRPDRARTRRPLARLSLVWPTFAPLARRFAIKSAE
jgi:hypothetical protein